MHFIYTYPSYKMIIPGGYITFESGIDVESAPTDDGDDGDGVDDEDDEIKVIVVVVDGVREGYGGVDDYVDDGDDGDIVVVVFCLRCFMKTMMIMRKTKLPGKYYSSICTFTCL